MTRVGVEIIVHSVQKSVSLDLGRATARVVDVVVLHGDEVVRAGEVHSPVVVSGAASVRRPAASTIDIAVGDCDATGCFAAEDEVLATDAGDCYVVDPDEVCAIDGESVASPDIGRVCRS